MHHRAKILGEIATNLSIKSGDKIAEVVACYRELLVKHRRAFYAEEIGAMRLSISEAGARLGVMNLLSKYIMEIGFVIGGIAIGASQFILQPAGRAVGVISVFLVASTRIVPAVLRVQTGLVAIKVSVGTAKATLDLIEEYSTSIQVEESQIIPNFPSLAHEGFVGNVVLNEVRFRYPGRDNNAISNLSIEIDEGEFFGVVGPSGSGKTTLVDLMMGVLNPDQGLVSISNESPRNAVRLWPGAIAYVPQEVCIIKGTIKDNICLGFDSRNIGNQAIEEILKNAQLGEFLSLSEGIHSLLGDKGNSLSGGQRQRLGIARALLTKPKLLILDEATSGLDALTEERLSDYLFSLKGQLTLIVIAHRLSTIKKADRILYLGDGNVKGIGDFDQLRISVCDFDKQASLMGF
jgi:ABC-type multidrug transport system fused ATPase/permease subunit